MNQPVSRDPQFLHRSPTAADFEASRLIGEADGLVDRVLAELPAPIEELSDGMLKDLRATAVATVVAKRSPDLASHLAAQSDRGAGGVYGRVVAVLAHVAKQQPAATAGSDHGARGPRASRRTHSRT